MYKVKISPDNITFNVTKEETILTAGINHQLNLPHSCKNGKCSSCKCKIIEGTVRLDDYSEQALSAAEISAGYTLLCKAFATSDITIDLPGAINGFPIKMVPAKVEKIEIFNHIVVLSLKLPSSIVFQYAAGQYIDIMLKNTTRSYSLANYPNQNNQIELHIKHHPNGAFSSLIGNEIKEQSILRFKGPLGTFKLHHNDQPIIFICTGTGFAPVKAMLEELVERNDQREVSLYWGNREISDFYLLDQLAIIKQKLNLSITLCTSQQSIPDHFSGYVTQALEKNFADLTEYMIYACGNINMINDVYNLATTKLKLPNNSFFSDVFTPAVTSAK